MTNRGCFIASSTQGIEIHVFYVSKNMCPLFLIILLAINL